MPSASKTRWSQLKVGLMAIFALSILAGLIILLTGVNPLFRKAVDVYTYFSDSSAMTGGATPVRLNGIQVGKVKKVELSGSSDPVRIVKITLSIYEDNLSSIPVDSQALLATQNLLGTPYVNIKKGHSPQTIQAGAEIPSGETPALQDLFQQGNSTLYALQTLVTRMDGIVSGIETGQGTIGLFLKDPTLYNRAVGLVAELQKLAVSLNGTDSSIGKLIHDDTFYEDYRGVATRVNTLLDGLNAGDGAAGKLLKDPALYDDARGAIADLRGLIAKVDHGDGTASKLLNSDELHEQLKTSLGKMDALLDKINNGQGTISQLLNNPLLYENLTGTTHEMQGLMQDFRSNPKKFLHLKFSIF